MQSVEAVRGTDFADTFDATGFTASSTNAGSAGVDDSGAALNEFEGMGGDDTITGNGNTRVSYLFALTGVTVDIQAGTGHGTAPGDLAGVGTDTFTGVNSIEGSEFNDLLFGSLDAPGRPRISSAASATTRSTVVAASTGRSTALITRSRRASTSISPPAS